MSNRQKYLLISTVSLFFGGSCYILFRSDTYISQLFRLHAFSNIPAFRFLCFYLPDHLWGLSLSMGLMWVYEPESNGAILCAACSFLCGCIWELLQTIALIPGTGDLFDILMYLSASIFSILLFRKVRNET